MKRKNFNPKGLVIKIIIGLFISLFVIAFNWISYSSADQAVKYKNIESTVEVEAAVSRCEKYYEYDIDGNKSEQWKTYISYEYNGEFYEVWYGNFSSAFEKGTKFIIDINIEGVDDKPQSITVFLLLQSEEGRAQQNRHGVRCGNGDPDTVDSPDQGQNQNRAYLKYQRPQEGNQGGSQAVAEGGKEAGEKHGKAHKQEGDCENTETGDGKGRQLRVVTHEEMPKGHSQHLSCRQHSDTEGTDQNQALSQQAR